MGQAGAQRGYLSVTATHQRRQPLTTQVRVLDSRSVQQSISREKLAYEVAKTVFKFAQPEVWPTTFTVVVRFLSVERVLTHIV